MGLHDVLSLLGHLLELSILLGRRLDSLLLDHLLGDQGKSDRVACELRVHLDLLVIFKDGLVDLLEQNFDLGVTESHHCTSEVLWVHSGLLDNLSARKLAILVEEAQDGGLENIRDQLILLCCVGHGELDRAVREEPRQGSVRLLLLKEALKFLRANLELR